MKHLPKMPIILSLFSFSAMMGGLFSTDVYLINKTTSPLIQHGVTTYSFPYVSPSKKYVSPSKKNVVKINTDHKTIKVNPGQKVKLFSIPRIISSFRISAYQKFTKIKHQRSGITFPFHVNAASRRVLRTSTILTKLTWSDVYSRLLKIEIKDILKPGKIYKDIHLTVSPKEKSLAQSVTFPA